MHMEREASDIDDAVETETIVINRKDAALEQRKVCFHRKLHLLEVLRNNREKFAFILVTS